LFIIGVVIDSVKSNSDSKQEQKIKFVPGPHLIGLTREQIREKCGEPYSVNHIVLDNGLFLLDKEQWSFNNPTFYIYLRNGVSESIQYAENSQNFKWNP
jgi:hypothetical protein